jgi:hypothetical protein
MSCETFFTCGELGDGLVFPCLVIYEDAIVIATRYTDDTREHFVGTLIRPGETIKKHEVGYHSNTWLSKGFKVFEGPVTMQNKKLARST